MIRAFLVASLIGAVLLACSTSPTGRKQLIVLPDSQLDSMGAQSFEQMKKQTPEERSPQVNAFVRCITAPILEVSKGKAPVENWEVVVFRDESANAFALPGGKIGVHTGILKVAKSDAQLAAVIGHEVGHVIARHGGERVSQGIVAQVGMAGVSAFLGESKNAPYIMAALGAGAQFGVLLPFGRAHESEADRIGLELMSDAGFDPRQSVELWKNMGAAGGKQPPQFMSTHPSHETRIQGLESRMGESMQRYERARAAGRAPRCPHPG